MGSNTRPERGAKGLEEAKYEGSKVAAEGTSRFRISIYGMNTRSCNGATRATTEGSRRVSPEGDGASLDELDEAIVRSFFGLIALGFLKLYHP